MTLFEMEDQFPNGFHDAQLNYIHIDYETRSALLGISVDFSNIEQTREIEYRKIELTVAGLSSLTIDGPVEYKSSEWKGGRSVSGGIHMSMPLSHQSPEYGPTASL